MITKMKIREKLQFINCFPEWMGFYFTRLDPDKTDMVLVYKWYFGFLWFEVRRWVLDSERTVDGEGRVRLLSALCKGRSQTGKEKSNVIFLMLRKVLNALRS